MTGCQAVGLVSGSKKPTDKTSYDCCTKSYPTIFVTTMMVALVRGMGFGLRGWTVVSVFLGSRGVRCGGMFRNLMLMRMLRCTSIAITRSSEGCAAECKAGKSENHELFESFVHNTPSLSSSVLMRTILAAYN